MIRPTVPWQPLTVAVFCKPSNDPARVDIISVHLEADAEERWAAEAIARGYEFCGHVALTSDGEPDIRCEPGDFAAVAMLGGGARFAELLGPIVQQRQLKAQRNESVFPVPSAHAEV